MPPGFTFVDLFCGIGGFHQALSRFGGRCVFASEIDPACVRVYRENYGIDAAHDIMRTDAGEIPRHDVLCAGFPCQAFSKAGKQAGVNDTRGTLFFEVERVLRHHRPRFILLENVRNLVAHDGGRTWKIITGVLRDIGYRLTAEPLILSPHQFGVPQLRERVYIAGVWDPANADKPLELFFDGLKAKSDNSICGILETVSPATDDCRISQAEENVLKAWDEFYRGVNAEVISFPVNTDYFHYEGDLDGLPGWKRKHVLKNKELYASNKTFIDGWLARWDRLSGFTPSQRKFEWQCGRAADSVFGGLIQMRPSGVRVKAPNAFPALVAMVQTPIIGRLRRRLTVRECARLQSFPDDFKLCPDRRKALRQLGNSVNVKVVEAVFRKLIASVNAPPEP